MFAFAGEMKFNCRSFLERTGERFGRTIAFVLLAGIVYSVSFGTVHRHGNAGSSPNAFTAASFVGTAASSFSLPGKIGTQTEECLICVLHQQFSNSTVHSPHFVVTSEPEIKPDADAAVFYHSSPIVSSPVARLSGRAPPSYLG